MLEEFDQLLPRPVLCVLGAGLDFGVVEKVAADDIFYNPLGYWRLTPA